MNVPIKRISPVLERAESEAEQKKWRRDVKEAIDQLQGMTALAAPGGTTIINNITQGGGSGTTASDGGPLLKNHNPSGQLAPFFLYGMNPTTGQWDRAYCNATRASMIRPEFTVRLAVSAGENFAPVINGVMRLKMQNGQTANYPTGDRRAWLTSSATEPGTIVVGADPGTAPKVLIGRLAGRPDANGFVDVLAQAWEVN